MNRPVKLEPKEEAALRHFADAARAALGKKLIDIRLYGSKARGDSQPDSDIDVFLLVHDVSYQLKDQISDLAFDLSVEHEVYISPVVVDAATAGDPVWQVTPFLRAVREEGIPL